MPPWPPFLGLAHRCRTDPASVRMSCTCTPAVPMPPLSGCWSSAGSQPWLSPALCFSRQAALPGPPSLALPGTGCVSCVPCCSAGSRWPSQPPSRAGLRLMPPELCCSFRRAPAGLARHPHIGGDGKAAVELDSVYKTAGINRNSMAESRAETVLLKTKRKKKKCDFQFICAALSFAEDLRPWHFHIANDYKKCVFKIALKGRCCYYLCRWTCLSRGLDWMISRGPL